ncbi:hypothetical protein GVN21_16875 [Caulobacter sp. SLTY]|uniref:phage protease n=1 Tax=Caulobacter sp. SLTY TaxID=2683262 RepID=UPI00141207FD|nr:phage protease [Caulobacter sp. SLTY]NBB17042.1 hypothetical protein [Caulobacter sp. SLTY]
MSLANICFAGVLAAASSSDGAPLRVVKLFPMGEIVARDGRRWRLDDRSHADQVVAASLAAAGGTDLVFDYDHQSFFGAKDGVGGQAPASGWMRKLWAEDDGIYAEVDWTEPAAARLKAREYRYVSPLFTHERGTGRITRLVNASLVNTPAITELPAVASHQEGLTPEGPSMKFTDQLAETLGLQAGATEAQILAALTTTTTSAASAATTVIATALGPIASALGLKADAKPDDIVAAASAAVAAKADPSKFAPMEVVTALQGQVKALTEGQAVASASAEVDGAIAAGKLAPAQKDWALSYATADLAGFKTFVAGSPVIVDPTRRTAANPAAPGAEPVLTNELQAAAAALGVSVEDVLATAKEEQQ